jgi:hypothetical protein
MSGGLDSILAARTLMEQGVDVVGVTMTSPFFGPERGEAAAAMLGVEHRVRDITDPLLEILKAPRHGFGRFVNPCVDCHALMVRTCAGMLEEEDARFVATGEVLGERPKSQHERALRVVEKDGGLPGLVLRPLSAQLLPETIPEREGWVDRQRLHALSGRTRTGQFELARRFQISEFPNPGGGCRLADPAFAVRTRALMEAHPGSSPSSFSLMLLGRHVWEGLSLIVVGRDKAENGRIAALAEPADILVALESDRGPTTLVRWPTPTAIATACTMTARYSQERDADEVALLSTDVASGETRRRMSRDHLARREFPLLDENGERAPSRTT